MKTLLVAIVLISAVFGGSCALGDLSSYRDCVKDDLPDGQTLHDGGDTYYEQISRQRVIEALDSCYDLETEG